MNRAIIGLSVLAVVGFLVGLGLAIVAGQFTPTVYRSAPPSSPGTVYCPPGSSPPPPESGLVCGGPPPSQASAATEVAVGAEQPIVVAAVLIALVAGVLMLISAARNDQGGWVAAIIATGLVGLVGTLVIGALEALAERHFPTIVEFAPVPLILIVTLAYARFGAPSRHPLRLSHLLL